ncbi:hypothetical protein APE01nite_20320 [Acetobacter peroxydans]|uniref:Uncharacterized protein n=1 Tax=Acetobacter peroxydans TaxID=104098 RepID=A0A4Y3TZU8_9PROT|nr:hypothetical protein AA13755_0521 [Acetobacter peroxydans NBRC 13755]GEB86235.1 hypothetical protein APE01nite_20320 [Acetobacter peroxydans]
MQTGIVKACVRYKEYEASPNEQRNLFHRILFSKYSAQATAKNAGSPSAMNRFSPVKLRSYCHMTNPTVGISGKMMDGAIFLYFA